MSTRRVRTGFTAAVLATSLAACGTAADPDRDGRSAAAPERPAADTNPLTIAATRLAVLRRPRSADDQWPAFALDNRPGDALVVDRAAGRRLFAADDPPYGLWLVPGRLVTGTADQDANAPRNVCLRVMPFTGPGRGGGGSACAEGDVVGRDGTLLVTELPDATPRAMVVAGTVPDGVRSVRLVDRGTGDVERRPIRDNVFLFETTRSAKDLRYRGPDGRAVTRPIEL